MLQAFERPDFGRNEWCHAQAPLLRPELLGLGGYTCEGEWGAGVGVKGCRCRCRCEGLQV